MILSNTDFNVLYVDPSATSSGDGSSVSSALNALPTSASDIADNTCFLVRRTSSQNEVTLPQGTNANIKALAIIGMPKSTDAFYTLMPEEAQSAWGEDEAEYANVKAVTSDSPYGGTTLTMTLDGCLEFFLHRINLYRDGQSSYEVAINLSNTTQTSSVAIEHCRFGLKGYELESSTCTTAPSYGAGMYIQVGKAQVVSLVSCVFNAIIDSDSYYGASYAVNVQSTKFLTVCDIDVWSTTSSYSYGGGSSSSILSFGSSQTTCLNANCEALRFHYVQNGSNSYLPALFYLYGEEFTALRAFSIVVESERQLGSGTIETMTPAGTLVTSEYAGEFVYENLTANLPKVWNLSQSGSIFRLAGRNSSNYPGCSKVVKNITVTLGSKDDTSIPDISDTFSQYQNTDDSTWSSLAALQLGFSDAGGCKEPLIADNVKVVNYGGVALYASYCYVKNCTLQGMLRAKSVTCDIDTLDTWFPGYAVGATSGCTIRIGTLTVSTSNISGSDGTPAILGNPVENDSYIFIGTCNTVLATDTRGTSTSKDNCYAMVCANEQDTGHYTMRTVNGMCNTWGVARNGSSVSASLKLFCASSDGKGFISLGRQPFAGFAVEAKAGARVFVLHIATKGLSQLEQLSQRVLVQLSVPQSDGTCQTLLSRTSGRWSQEEAQWIGESSLTPYKLEIPLAIASDCTVDVKFHYRWYSTSGYLYLDPAMVIE